MVKARKYIVKKKYQGMPKRDDFEIVEFELPQLKDNEVLVKAEWISVDPYMRSFSNMLQVPYDQFGAQVGIVIETKNPKYPVGARVISNMGWCDHTIVRESEKPFEGISFLPSLQGLPNELALGVVGLPGATAYFGFLEICKPKPGETVAVTVAAGAVGSVVGQIAKIKGCKVIGFAGSDEKVMWLEKELGFDKAINYKTADIISALKQAAPGGIDCYFDNVGGEMSSIIMSQMNLFGRVSVCGCISAYNSLPQLPKATIIQQNVVDKELIIEGFLVLRWKDPEDRFAEAFSEIVKWIKSGQIKYRNHVTEGFDNIFNAFVGMLSGENIGKTIVKV